MADANKPSPVNPALALANPDPFPLFLQPELVQLDDQSVGVWSKSGFKEPDLDHPEAVALPARVVTISLLNGTANQKEKVRRYAPDWRRAAPIIRFRFVDGIHGYVRVAFDDIKTPRKAWHEKDLPFERTVKETTWAYIGKQNFFAFDTPENVHIGRIEDKAYSETTKAVLREEKKYIHHAFGHVLGLAFAGELPNEEWRKRVVKAVAPSLGWPRDQLKDRVDNPKFDSKLKTPSVMEFDWKSDITFSDWVRIAELYPIPAGIVRSSIRDIAERTADHDEDLDLYILGTDSRIYRNRRHYKKKPKTDEGEHRVSWTYWSDVLEESPRDVPVADKDKTNTYPSGCKDFAVLDLADRLELLVVDTKGNLWRNYQTKGTNAWQKEWDIFKRGSGETLVVQKLKILEVEGGYEVIYIRRNGKLGHFTRKNGDPELNKEFHPIPVENPISKIVAARVGPPTNPIKIYAASEKDIYCAELDNKTLTWTLTSVNAEHILRAKRDLAFGMAGTTENAFVIDDQGKLWHNKNLNGGWVDWNDGLPKVGVELKSIAIGEASTRDAESRYLQVFVLAKDGDIYYNRVHEEGNWGPSNDVDPSDNTDWINIRAKQDTLTTLKNVPRAEDIYTKRAKCGDLELFVVEKDTRQIHRLNIDNNGFANKNFEPRIWGDLEKLEEDGV